MTRHVYLRFYGIPCTCVVGWLPARIKRQEIQSLVVPQNANAVTVRVTQFVIYCTYCPNLAPGLHYKYIIDTTLVYNFDVMYKKDHVASTMPCLLIILLRAPPSWRMMFWPRTWPDFHYH